MKQTSELRVGLVPTKIFKPSSNFLIACSNAVLLLWVFFVFCVSCVSGHTGLPCGHLLGKVLILCSHVCDVFLGFYHFPVWCPGSGVIVGCIDSLSLHSSLLSC